MFGVGADWQAMDTLKLTASYLYVTNEGNATFGVQNNLASADAAHHRQLRQQQAAVLQPEGRLRRYNRNWSFTGGYSYMKYSHDDIATDGYQYVLPIVRRRRRHRPNNTNNTSLSYLNGYDAFTDGHHEHLLPARRPTSSTRRRCRPRR